MTFEEAEGKFKELQARVQRGEAISRAEYEDQVSRLAVQDQFGVLWEINPRTGKWMYFDGAEWVSGAPPGKESSTVIPLSSLAPKPGSVVQPAVKPTPAPSAPSPMPTRSAPPPTARPSASPQPASAPKPYTRVAPTAPNPERAARRASSNPFGPGREWIPLAIGAVVLLLCAVLLGGIAFVMNSGDPSKGFLGLGAAPTATRTPTRPIVAATTAIPTAVRLPSPTAIPPTPVPVIAKVTEKTANVRAEANAKSAKVSELKQNAQITLIAKTNDGQFDWYQINIAGQAKPGWIRSDLVQIVSGDPKTLSAPGAPAPAPVGPATPTVIGAPTPTRKP